MLDTRDCTISGLILPRHRHLTIPHCFSINTTTHSCFQKKRMKEKLFYFLCPSFEKKVKPSSRDPLHFLDERIYQNEKRIFALSISKFNMKGCQPFLLHLSNSRRRQIVLQTVPIEYLRTSLPLGICVVRTGFVFVFLLNAYIPFLSTATGVGTTTNRKL